jgi:hypothetical protein
MTMPYGEDGEMFKSSIFLVGTHGYCSPRHKSHFEPSFLSQMASYDVD